MQLSSFGHSLQLGLLNYRGNQMLVRIAFILVTVFTTNAFADSMRAIGTDDLTCTGKAKGSKQITLKITASPGRATKLVIQEKGGKSRELLNKEDLIVGSEGNVYIQQVSNELGYNLYLAGEGLDEVLDKGVSREVNLGGSLDLFNDGVNYSLTCSGTVY